MSSAVRFRLAAGREPRGEHVIGQDHARVRVRVRSVGAEADDDRIWVHATAAGTESAANRPATRPKTSALARALPLPT